MDQHDPTRLDPLRSDAETPRMRTLRRALADEHTRQHAVCVDHEPMIRFEPDPDSHTDQP